MFKVWFAGLSLISMCGNVFAGCGDPLESDAVKQGLVHYINPHEIYEPADGNMIANDVLEVWSKQADHLCFFATFVTDNVHICFIGGKAVKTTGNKYGYSENRCRVSIEFVGNKVRLTATGPEGNGCSPEDLSEENGCGFNTSIESATFIKQSNQVKKR